MGGVATGAILAHQGQLPSEIGLLRLSLPPHLDTWKFRCISTQSASGSVSLSSRAFLMLISPPETQDTRTDEGEPYLVLAQSERPFAVQARVLHGSIVAIHATYPQLLPWSLSCSMSEVSPEKSRIQIHIKNALGELTTTTLSFPLLGMDDIWLTTREQFGLYIDRSEKSALLCRQDCDSAVINTYCLIRPILWNRIGVPFQTLIISIMVGLLLLLIRELLRLDKPDIADNDHEHRD